MKLYEILAQVEPFDDKWFRMLKCTYNNDGLPSVWFKMHADPGGNRWIAYAECGTWVKDLDWLTVDMLLNAEWEFAPPGYKYSEDPLYKE